eukprot:gene9635-biopygen12243
MPAPRPRHPKPKMPIARAARATPVPLSCSSRGKLKRARTGRGPHDRVQRNGRGPDVDPAVSPCAVTGRGAKVFPPHIKR